MSQPVTHKLGANETNPTDGEGEKSSGSSGKHSSDAPIAQMGEAEADPSLIRLDFTDKFPLEFFIEYFEEYDDEDFVNTINLILTEFDHLQLENEIFIQYLKDNEPTMLETFEEANKRIKILEQKQPLLPAFFQLAEEGITADSMPFVAGAQVNISTRLDLAARYMDDVNLDLAKYEKYVARQCKRYKSRIEEASIHIEEVEDARAVLEQNIVIDAVDPITQRIPAEKFIQFMHDWMKNARSITERIRVNSSYMKVTYKKLKALHEQKEELGISLSNSDFEALRIRNNHLDQLINQKNQHLVELKQINGAASLELATTKTLLLNLDIASKKLKQAIRSSEKEKEAFIEETITTAKNLYIAKTAHRKVKQITDNCKAPDTLSYLRVKHDHNELVKRNRILCRQENLMAITRRSYEMNLIRVTHQNAVNPRWYEPVQPDVDDTSITQHEPILSEFDIYKAINVNPMKSTTSFKRTIK